jgi:hypothetical protein
MALIAVAADKGAPGVTTASVALAAVWPRPVLLAECDPAGGDLIYRLPTADGGRLDPRRGLLSLAVAARRGLQPHQVWEHAQKLRGGLDILVGVGGAEQGAGLELLWGSVGRVLAAVPQADVIADCGRLGVDGPVYDLLAQASAVVLLTRVSLGEVIRLRDRVSMLAASLQRRGRPAGRIDVVVITDYKNFGAAITEVGQALRQGGAPARVVGGLAYEPKSANQLRGQWTGKLDKSMFIRTARAIAGDLASALPGPASGTRRSAPAASPAPVPPASPAARPASGPAARPGSGLAASPVSGPASGSGRGPASASGRGPASDAASASGRSPDDNTATASVFEPTVSRPQGPRPSRTSYLAGPERPDREPYLAGPERPDREPRRDPAALDGDRTPHPTRPAPAPPGRLAARGRHAGTPAAADGQDQRPPERDDAQQAEAHPLRPEPTSGTSQGRPRSG